MPPTLNAQQFVAKWRQNTLKERSAAQSHFNDLCALLGEPTPAEADPKGIEYTFEAGAAKSSGGEGFADVWKRRYFAWEYKGQHADLEKAYQQLLQYRESLENPPLLIASDMQKILIRTNFTNTVRREYALTLDDLLDPKKLDILRLAFTNPDALKAPQTTKEVTEQAAAHFARLADILRRYGEDPQRAAHFLIRLLFCLFAEDAGILPNQLFSRLARLGQQNPKLFHAQLKQLFAAMRDGGAFGVEEIPHVNGGLFNDDTVLALDGDALRILAEVCALDWANIEPSIFGALFERSLDPAKRSQLGAHYTSKEDILLIVEPVLMAPLRKRWEEIKTRPRGSPTRPRGSQRPTRSDLQDFAAEIGHLRVLDPACGSGNFLYVALRSLLDLWKEVTTHAAEGRTLPMPSELDAPSPEKLFGLEINPYAYELAQVTVWIGYIQWLRENGYSWPRDPVLRPLDNIRLMDAILAHDAEGRPVEPEWPEADVIIGNPPFLGGGKIRSELGNSYTEDLFKLYGDRLPNFSDLVCYWHEKARAQIEKGKAKRAGLLATQAIRGGANRKVLERIKQSGDIFWAQSDRNWILDGATVHVSMVAFDDGAEKGRVLDGQVVEQINADLTASTDLTVTQPLTENTRICFMGPSAKAPFDIDAATAQRLLVAPFNINGRPNSDVVRPVASAVDLVQGTRGVWTIDFAMMSEDEAAQYEAPFEYARNVVLPVRKTRRDDYRGQWWQYARPRPEMRAALANLARYIATPGVAKHRIFAWVSPEVLCNQGTLVFARDDDYFFGVLHSKLHELWARGTGTQLREAESGFRYTPTTTFETYPFPWPPGSEPRGDARVERIAQAARELVEKRENWLHPKSPHPDPLPKGEGGAALPSPSGGRAGDEGGDEGKRTLTGLYNARPSWLQLAHHKLDEAVLAAYGWASDLGDEEILARLLSLNQERAGG
jgi:hypothetical protein